MIWFDWKIPYSFDKLDERSRLKESTLENLYWLRMHECSVASLASSRARVIVDTGPVEDNSVAFLCWYACCNPDTLQVESMLVDSNLHAGNKVQNLLNQVLIRTGSTPCSD